MGGSGICETNTFYGTGVTQNDFKLSGIVYELNKERTRGHVDGVGSAMVSVQSTWTPSQ
jgi:hypothetical protein